MTARAGSITVVIVDDQPVIREGFKAFLDYTDDIHVVGEAADGEQALEVVGRHSPDIVLMDIRMPVMDGLTATRIIVEKFPFTKVIILTTFDLDEYVFEALHAGASGFLLKDTEASQLAQAVRIVHEGAALLAPQVTRRVIAAFVEAARRPAPIALDALTQLTDREREAGPDRPRSLELGDRQRPLHQRNDRQNTRQQRPGQAFHPRPGARRRARLRNRLHPTL